MSDTKQPPEPDAKTRLAQALRANLRRRKAQLRARAAAPAPQSPDQDRKNGESTERD